jgi:hypothetical protein
MTILKEYVTAVTKRADEYQEAEDYYLGNISERFASAKLRRALRATNHRGQHNYVKVITDAVLNRLEIANIVADSPDALAKITEVWDANEMAFEANEIHRSALEFGDAYAMVWPDENGELLISLNSPLTTAIVYDPENPRKKLYAVKIWKQSENETRMNVYFPDEIRKFTVKASEITDATNWQAAGREDNPFGEVPVFHFRTHRPYGRPEAYEAYGAQDDLNKLLATHMFTVDYQGAPQRYALSGQGDADVLDLDDNDTARENANSLEAAPGNLWFLKGVSQVGEFKPADSRVFWEPIGNLKQSMAALTSTPFHFLDRANNVPSGEGLRVAEAPLMKKVRDRQTSFAVTWRELFNFVLMVEGTPARLEVKWDIVESMDSLNEWDVMLKKINAGLSHRQALREAGYEEANIEKIMAERDAEAAQGAFYQRTPQARVSTNNNETFGNRNGLTDAALNNGGGQNP